MSQTAWRILCLIGICLVISFKLAVQSLFQFLVLIKFSHTLFALPFALMGALLALRRFPLESTEQIYPLIAWVMLAMAGARTGAMGFNRLVDMRIDAANPRTANRPSVTGQVSTSVMVLSIIAAYGLLVFASYQLNPVAFQLSPVAIFLVSAYSYTKRFTSWCHLFLGLAIGASPIAAWIAVTGSLSLSPLVLGASVMLWIAGFDIIYALQDRDYDKSHGLNSIPVRFGVGGSLWIARGLHLTSGVLWFYLGYLEQLGLPYTIAAIGCSGLLLFEHRLVRKGNLEKIDMAFFNLNIWISLGLFVGLLVDWSLT